MSATEDLEARLDELEDQDVITAEDLEAFRKQLPTDSLTAKALQKALPYPWGEVFEYVEGSERQTAYWRVAADRSEPRSAAEAEVRRRFGEAASQSRRRGTVERDGRVIPAISADVADAVEGESSDDGAGDVGTGQKALSRLRSVLDL